MAPAVPNPNWPTLFAEGDFGANPYYLPGALLVYTDMTPRLYKAWSVRRGKQFELDQVQPGEFHGQWVNQDGALDPSNATSYYSPGVVPYRGFRIRTQYPPSINVLGGDQATGGEVTPLGAGTSGVAYGVKANGTTMTTFLVTASGTAWQGTQVWQATGTTANGNTIFFTNNIPVQGVLNTTYTFSAYVRSVTTGANPVITPGVVWISSTGNPVSQVTGSNVTLTGSPTATWTRVTFTASVPGPSFGLYPNAIQPFFQLATSPGGTWSFQMDGLQLEAASTVSAFSAPGVAYPVYSGLIERYPQSWDYNGTYDVVSPVCVDTMALLSQTVLKEAFITDVVNTNPTWFFPLNEPSGSTSFAEQAGRTSNAGPLFSATQGPGSLTAGNSVTATTLPSGKFFGTNGPVITVNNTTQNQGTVIDMTSAIISYLPTSGEWTRMIAFRSSQTLTGTMAAYSCGQNPGSISFTGNMYFELYPPSAYPNMGVSVSFWNAAGQQLGVTDTLIVNDGNWHLAFVQMSADGKTITAGADGSLTSNTGANDMHPTALVVNESVGGDEYKSDGTVGYGFTQYQGDLALYAHWNYILSAGQIANLVNSFKVAWQGDTSDQRYSRILSWAGYQGSSTLDPGNTTTMGPANDIGGLDALSALNNVVATEGGRHFVGVDGTINFQNRQRFFQATTPVWTFGENTAGGEIPYVDLAFDFDPTRISNSVTITQSSNGLNYYAIDTTSQQAYGVRNLSRTNQSTNNEEVRESAYYYLSRYKDPHLRVQTLRLDPAANPSLWTSILSFELGQYVKINRRDPFGVRPTITQFGFIEQIMHSADDKGAWKVELQISPAATTAYGTFTSLRTTLSSTASSGQKVLVIAALPDAATNPVRSELTGGQLLLITGGGNSEFGTIAVGGVQNQAAGYSTANITLTANLAHTYSSGSTVVEATGSNYDALAAFGSIQFSY